MTEPSEKEIEAVSKLPPSKRYSYFVKKVVGWGKAWALYQEGWATSSNADGMSFFPLWPSKTIAELNAVGAWTDYQAEELDLEELLDGLLPQLKIDGLQVGVFFVEQVGSVDVDPQLLIEDLSTELEKYN